MKRRDFIRHLQQQGCVLDREGGRHTIYRNPANGRCAAVPRHRNPPDHDGGPNHWEIWLRDPEGYTVVLASPDGTADGTWRP